MVQDPEFMLVWALSIIQSKIVNMSFLLLLHGVTSKCYFFQWILSAQITIEFVLTNDTRSRIYACIGT